MKLVIGLDYGTQSGRSLLVNTENGEVLASGSLSYPHGVMEGALASIEDYELTLMTLLEAVCLPEYRDSIVGICVDATSLTQVPVSADGRALALMPEFAGREQAQIKLWKRHAAQPQADECLALAKEMNEPFLKRTGGSVSSEWSLPKLMEMRDQDPEVYAATDVAFDLCEYLTYRLTGKIVRSAGSLGFKGQWARDLGFPTAEYLNRLRPGLAEEYAHRMRGPVLDPGDCAGTLSREFCERFGLKDTVVVATGLLDGHTSSASLGALGAGDVALVLGTSGVLAIQMEELCEMEGICGITLGGLTKGLYGVDAGQNCAGDMLEWYMRRALPESVFREAEEKGVSPHQLLCSRITRPWENRVIAVDWWNGSRNAPCDLSLRGGMAGLSIDTKPEDIYLALLQAIVCGSREILQLFIDHGVPVNRIIATGGIAGKNPLFMQEYANFLNRTVAVGQIAEGPAMGSAIFAAVAAGVYATPSEAAAHMGVKEFVYYEPDREHREEYEELYRKNHRLRCLLREL